MHGVYCVFPELPDFDRRIAVVVKWAGDRPFVFCGDTAAYMHGLVLKPPEVISIAVPRNSGLRSNARCVVNRSRYELMSVGTPPRTSLEATAVDLVGTADGNSSALNILMTAIQKRMDVERFLDLVRKRPRLRNRRLIETIFEITDLQVESYLELAYCRNVERRHGLPQSVGQKRERIRGRWIRSDRWYRKFGVRSELDGEIAHPGKMTNADVIRDNDVRLALDEITLRFRWYQVMVEPCLAAAQVARALQRGGWRGHPKKCSPACMIEKHLGSYS